jgi:hypothetical protein
MGNNHGHAASSLRAGPQECLSGKDG